MKNELILEIGTEEIPALFLEESSESLKEIVVSEFKDNFLQHGEVEVFYTPRRIVLRVHGLLPDQSDQIIENFGPPKNISFDQSGNPTKAAIGFAKSHGADVTDLEVVKRDKGEFLALRQKIKGNKTSVVLKNLVPEIIGTIPFKKSMRWGNGKTTFARPIRWIMCLYNSRTVNFKIENIKSGSKTYGHRFTSPKSFSPKSWSDYIGGLKKRDVVLDQNKRKEIIVKNVTKQAEKLNGKIEIDEILLTTVANLVEYPLVLVGKFEEKFLNLPREVLISVMKNHQKYFHVSSKDGSKLLPRFIFICGTPLKKNKVVIKGNERVIRARFTDAGFFWNEDKKNKLENNLDQLESMVFLSEIGNYHQKIQRLKNLAYYLSELSGKKNVSKDVVRAATLCKADLVTQMVFEFPELQGTIGKYYAENSGEKAEVSLAIEEHYMPTTREGKLPESMIGSLLSIADKVDNISSCFLAGLKPSGSSDPHALRRQAIGIIQIVIDKKLNFGLEKIFSRAIDKIKDQNNSLTTNEKHTEIKNFLLDRFKNYTIDIGYSYDTVEAVVSANFDNIYQTWQKVKALEEFRKLKDFEAIAIAFKRVVNIVKIQPGSEVNPGLFNHKTEKELYKIFLDVKKRADKILQKNSSTIEEIDYKRTLEIIKELKLPVDNFFDDVMVMVKDEKIRNNRLALLWQIRNLFFKIADFSKLETQ